MSSINLNNTSTLNPIQSTTLNSSNATQQPVDTAKPLPLEPTQVNISEEGKALLSALSETDEGKELLHALSEINNESEDDHSDEVNNHLTSFAYGALGIDNPDEVAEKEKDTSYTAGQYLKGALTVGSILLAIV